MSAKKLSAEELANKLEQKAKELREHGLSKDDMDKIAGGGCECCGSSCQTITSSCQNYDSGSDTCRFNCISSSPD